MNQIKQSVRKIRQLFRIGTSGLISTLSLVGILYLPTQARAEGSPPTIEHDTLNGSVAAGQDHTIFARVIDPDTNISSLQVNLYFRSSGQETFAAGQTMNRKLNSDQFVYTIKGVDMQPPGIEYYLTAQDPEGNLQSRGFPFDPLSISVKKLDLAENTANSGSPASIENTGRQGQRGFSFSDVKPIWYVAGAVVTAGLFLALSDSGGDDDPGDCNCQFALQF